MASTYFIADDDGGNIVYFDYDPSPIPVITNDRKVLIDEIIPSSLGGDSNINDVGAPLSSRRIKIRLGYMSQAVKNSLQSKYDAIPAVQVRFYHARFAITYLCSWAPGNSLDAYFDEGKDIYFTNIELIPTSIV